MPRSRKRWPSSAWNTHPNAVRPTCWMLAAAKAAMTAWCMMPLPPGRPCVLAGFDLSKDAIRLAAKLLPEAAFAVGGSFSAPVRDGWADVLLNIFSPFAGQEFCRVLRSGGVLLYAVPTARHLYGLKEVLYDEPYENAEQQTEYSGFTLIGERTVTDTITVEGDQIRNLFAMTPYFWKTPHVGALRLAAKQSLTTEIGFRFLAYRRV